ncbi:MAG: hypothetical protein NZ653_06045, partial [Anaerolineae bacterium]|nr:hypothetical protein [Anaerolineae bacterium]
MAISQTQDWTALAQVPERILGGERDLQTLTIRLDHTDLQALILVLAVLGNKGRGKSWLCWLVKVKNLDRDISGPLVHFGEPSGVSPKNLKKGAINHPLHTTHEWGPLTVANPKPTRVGKIGGSGGE